MKDVEILLNEVTTLIKKRDLKRKLTASEFNLMEISGATESEAAICRMIFELLSPSGRHYQSDMYLKLFIHEVLKASTISKEELMDISVYRDYPVEKWQIALVIKTSRQLIPIEVKIKALDQDRQCYGYLTAASKYNSSGVPAQLYYLTPERRLPVAASRLDAAILENDSSTTGAGIIPISFGDEILLWLRDCLKQENTITRAALNNGIHQLVDVVRRLSKMINETERADCAKLLGMSSSNIIAAQNISMYLTDAYEFLISRLFKMLDARTGENFCKRYRLAKCKPNENLYAYQNYVDKFFRTKPHYCGIYFRCLNTGFNERDVELWFGIEMEDNLYAGFFLFDKRTSADMKEIPFNLIVKLKEIFKCEFNKYDCMFIWDYLPVSAKYVKADFFNMDAAAVSLFDNDKFIAAVDFMMSKVEELLLKRS